MGKTNSKWILPSVGAVIALCVACACCSGVGLYFYGDQIVASFNPPSDNPPTEILPTQPPVNTTSGLPEWTVIVYSAADDEVLEENMWFDINEMELVGSNPQLNIVVQIDRYSGAFTGDGDWSDTRRYLITQDNDLNTITSPIVESLGEVDTGDPQTLIDFVTWAVQNYPAKKYALIMSDHGGEIPMRAIHTRSERIKDLVSQAYKEKYNTPGSIRFVKDMSRKKSRDTTTELIPI